MTMKPTNSTLRFFPAIKTTKKGEWTNIRNINKIYKNIECHTHSINLSLLEDSQLLSQDQTQTTSTVQCHPTTSLEKDNLNVNIPTSNKVNIYIYIYPTIETMYIYFCDIMNQKVLTFTIIVFQSTNGLDLFYEIHTLKPLCDSTREHHIDVVFIAKENIIWVINME